MKNLHFLKLMIIPMFILFQTACVANDGKRETIERNYSVSAFNAIKSEVVGNIEVVQTSGNTVSVIGDKELVENLTVKVEDDKLKLSMKKELRNFKWKGKSSKLTIYVSAPDLVLIESEGVGNIRLNGDIAVASIKIDSEGVGNISSQNLTAEHVEIDSEGVGNITLNDIHDQVASPDVKGSLKEILAGTMASQYDDAVHVYRPRMQALYASYFGDNKLDAMMFPTTSLLAPVIDAVNGSSKISINGGPLVDTFATMIRNSDPGSTAGMPGISLPAGVTASGLPVGLSLDGPIGSDPKLIGIGLAMETVLGFAPPPRLAV